MWRVFLGLWLVPAAALANDSSMGGFGSDLAPMSSAQVRMKAEDILIRPVGKSWDEGGLYWEVEADYTFENLTDRPVTLQVGFPEYGCEGEPSDDDDEPCVAPPLPFESMRTTVDGQPVVHRKGTIKKGHPWRPRLGQVWLYDVTFAPGRETKVSHRYRVLQGAISDGTAFGYYVTRTGATWAGTIGHARFRIHVPVETSEVFVEPVPGRHGHEGAAALGLTLTTHVVEVKGARTGEILLEARDWEPKKDLHFGFYAEGLQRHATYEMAERDLEQPGGERCTSFVALWNVGQMRAEGNVGDRIVNGEPTEADVERFVKEGLGSARLCSAYIYATYGKRFEDEALNRRFYGADGWKPKGWPYGPLQPNPGYSDAMLAPGDRAALELIRRVEERITRPAPPVAPAAPAATAAPSSVAAKTPAVSAFGCSAHAPRAGGAAPPLAGLALLALVYVLAFRARGTA